MPDPDSLPLGAEVDQTFKMKGNVSLVDRSGTFQLALGVIVLVITWVFLAAVITNRASLDGFFEIQGLQLPIIIAAIFVIDLIYYQQAKASMARPDATIAILFDLLPSVAVCATAFYMVVCIVVWAIVDYFPQPFMFMTTFMHWLPFAPYNNTTAIVGFLVFVHGVHDLRNFHLRGRAAMTRGELTAVHAKKIEAPPGYITIFVRQTDIGEHGYALYKRRSDATPDFQAPITPL